MNIGKKIEEKLNKVEEKIFTKHNINESAKVMLRMIEDQIDAETESLVLLDVIEKYVEELQNLYQISLQYQSDDIQTSQLQDKILRQYSILKYFIEHRDEMMIDFSLEALTLLERKDSVHSFSFHNLEIEHILTNEVITLTKKEKKLLLALIKNASLTTNYVNYTFEIKGDQIFSNYVDTNLNQKTYLQTR